MFPLPDLSALMTLQELQLLTPPSGGCCGPSPDPDGTRPGHLPVVLSDAHVVPVGLSGPLAPVVPADLRGVLAGTDQPMYDQALRREPAGELYDVLADQVGQLRADHLLGRTFQA